ncbi:MAG TPA: hypothetical protein VF787_16805 [Thermoanaerobaculia bacterium]
MAACPYCERPTISRWQRQFASTAFPATCSYCHSLVAEHPRVLFAVATTILGQIVFAGAAIAALIMRSWFVFAGSLLAGWSVIAWWREPLVVVTEEQVLRSRVMLGMIAAVLVAFAFLIHSDSL